ncbi:glycosyl transferase group 1 [Burkholderia sp. H160]|nr:glycosyl transferase group 1 [Burkholderia sp. H160]
MKITLCANRFPPNVVGGAEVMVHALAVELKRRGHDVSVLTLSNTRKGKRTACDGLDVHVLPNLNVYDQFHHGERGRIVKMLFGIVDVFNPLMFALTWRRLRTLAPDVLCTNTLKGIGPALWVAARLRGVPVVHVNHDYWLLCPRSTMFARDHACETPCGQCRAVARPKAWLSRMVDRAVSVSRFVDERHRASGFFPRSEPIVVYNAPALMRGINGKLHVPGNPFKVGFIGRTDATKGIEQFFASVAAANVPNLEVHIAGKDNEQCVPALIARYPQLKVTHHGFMPREAFYELVDLVVVTSMWDEPFGIVGIEPWEFFKPSVAFASGGLPEIYARLPELLVPRGDIAALGALIARLARDGEFYDGVSRRCQADRSRFVPREQVDEFERIFKAAADKCAPNMSASAAIKNLTKNQTRLFRRRGVENENETRVNGDDQGHPRDGEQRSRAYASLHSEGDRH